MAGKPYTMREMRSIVEYLAERKAYGEVKGRKMWMEFANSEHTTRTWQSLKETFLKRILPDLQNPYYKLSIDQVRSFKQGHDVVEKEKNNRLEFRTASESSGTAENENKHGNNNQEPAPGDGDQLPTTLIDNEPSSTIIDNELEKATGEDVISAKIPSRSRSSAETVVLEYLDAEEQRELESPINDTEQKSKSYKDLLTFEYSAPVTPIVQELLQDFETESESSDKEPQLKIVENPPENVESESNVIENTSSQNCNTNKNIESVIEILDSEDSPETGIINRELETSVTNKLAQKDNQDKSQELQTDNSSKINMSQNNQKEDIINNETNSQEQIKEICQENPDTTNARPQDTTEFLTAESNAKTLETSSVTAINTKENSNTENVTQNTGNTSSDTLLPNNQEALNDSKKTNLKTSLKKTEHDAEKEKNNTNRSGKRTVSQDRRENRKQSDDKSNGTELHGRTTPVMEIITAIPNTECKIVATHENNAEIASVDIIEISTHTPTINETEEQFNDHLKTESKNTNKSNTSSEKVVSNIDEVNDIKILGDNDSELIGDKNPCLLSVSLFDEQFKNTKYSGNDSDDEATPVPKENQNKNKPQTAPNAKKEIENKSRKEVRKNKETHVIEVKDKKEQDGISVSSAECEPQRQGTVNQAKNVSKAVNLQRERALANVFGFAHGVGASTSRKRRVSHRRRSNRHQRQRLSKNYSNSSDWTSESDSESYVSPPRGRRSRHVKKYLKPKSSRIMQDPEQGMLYVIIGKSIYPLVKDGKHIKNFLTYRSDSDSDLEEESYWRQKYVEEKKRTDDFKKLLKENQESKIPVGNKAASPILPSPRTRNNRSQQMPVQNDSNNGKEVIIETEGKKVDAKDDKMVLKIASKNGLEYCLEGGWNQISNAMPQVVRMLQHETTTPNDLKLKEPPTSIEVGQMGPPIKNEVDQKSSMVNQQASKVDKAVMDISGMLTPIISADVVDPEVRAKVSKIESEIFKEIEEHEKAEQVRQNVPETTNITKRKPTRRRKDSTSSSKTATQSPAKRGRVAKTSSTESKQDATKLSNRKRVSKQDLDAPKDKLEPIGSDTEKPGTRARIITSEHQGEVKEPNQIVTAKVVEEQSDKTEEKLPSRKQSLRTSKQKEISEHSNRLESSDISPVRTRSRSKKYDTDSSASDIKLRSRKSTSKETTELIGFSDEDARFMFPPTTKSSKISPKGKNNRSLNVIPEQEISTGNSIDSTQGYQDSDVSPMKICLPKRKRKISLTIQRKYKTRRAMRRNSYPTLLQELVSDSNNSSYFVPMRNSQSCTLNSEVYKTDSYRLLVPKPKPSFNILDPIEEASNTNQVDMNIRHFNSVSKNSDKSSLNIEIGSSSNISLPLSPELSIVEKMSISREMINGVNHPVLNEMHTSNNAMDLSEFMISKLDISLPFMDQQCELENKEKITPKINPAKSTPYCDPQLNQVCAVRIENLTLSESLDQRLRELLLESNKKMSNRANTENAMEVDQTNKVKGRKTRTCNRNDNAMEVDETKIATTKKTKAKKRSSTPRKKKTAQTVKVPKDPVIEEEHTASYSQAGRKSCPPVITFLSIDENANNSADVTLNTVQAKTRKKKDIIKVKIQKPRHRQKSLPKEQLREKSVENASTTTYTDSGINDTETISAEFLKDSNDSVDLIHNHSETCLMANECIGDSLIFVENSNSVISVNSSKHSVDSELQKFLGNASKLSDELFSNVQDNAISLPRTSDEVFESETAYHTPAENNSSLITEDLSDELPTPPTKWYLLSEDDTNTRPASDTVKYGNLKQLFPVACAVPDLSTISEMSKENEDSRKPYFDAGGDTRNYDAQNLFDVFGNYF